MTDVMAREDTDQFLLLRKAKLNMNFIPMKDEVAHPRQGVDSYTLPKRCTTIDEKCSSSHQGLK